MWTFIFIDMVLFALLFAVFVAERVGHRQIFSTSQLSLQGWIGLANTLVLLTSSWTMAEAVAAGRSFDAPRCRRLLRVVLLLGFVFCGIKLAEYSHKLRLGMTPLSNSFFAFYYVLTGIHLLHLVGAMTAVAVIRGRIPNSPPVYVSVMTIENVGLFWHFVDVLWVIIFSILYLAGLAR